MDVIHRITNLKESYIIKEIKKTSWFWIEGVYQLSDAQRKRLTEAKTDKVLTEAEANSEIEKWLNEKLTGLKRPISKEKKSSNTESIEINPKLMV